MPWELEVTESARKDLQALEKKERQRIYRFFEERVLIADDPTIYAKPMTGKQYAGLWIFRVGNHRALCRLKHDQLLILMVHVEHRSIVYKRFSL